MPYFSKMDWHSARPIFSPFFVFCDLDIDFRVFTKVILLNLKNKVMMSIMVTYDDNSLTVYVKIFIS